MRAAIMETDVSSEAPWSDKLGVAHDACARMGWA